MKTSAAETKTHAVSPEFISILHIVLLYMGIRFDISKQNANYEYTINLLILEEFLEKAEKWIEMSLHFRSIIVFNLTKMFLW